MRTPTIWVERYHNPTWLEYVRHNQRMTKADAAIGENLRALHQGPEPPRVRRMIQRQTGWVSSDIAPARSIAHPLTDPGGSH